MYLLPGGNPLVAYLPNCKPACTPKSGLGRGILRPIADMRVGCMTPQSQAALIKYV